LLPLAREQLRYSTPELLAREQHLIDRATRPTGEWHAEWQALRSLLRLAAESADAAADLVAGLTVEHDAVERTLGLSPGLVRDRDAVVAAAGAVVDAAVARFHAIREAAR